jgi:hypothetical protein
MSKGRIIKQKLLYRNSTESWSQYQYLMVKVALIPEIEKLLNLNLTESVLV